MCALNSSDESRVVSERRAASFIRYGCVPDNFKKFSELYIALVLDNFFFKLVGYGLSVGTIRSNGPPPLHFNQTNVFMITNISLQ